MKFIAAIVTLFFFSAPLFSVEKTLSVPKGSNLAAVLKDEGIPNRQAHGALAALSERYDLRYISPDQEVVIDYDNYDTESEPFLKSLRIVSDFDEEILVRHNGFNYEAQVIKLDLHLVPKAAEGTIESSFYNDMAKAGVPGSKIMDLFRLYSFDVDFQRDIQSGDTFKVMFYDFEKEDGTVVKHGPIICSELCTGGEALTAYGFLTDSGNYDFYNAEGKSIRKTLLKTPVANARISSTYGRRKNPVYGYQSFHKGLDFAAPLNTPILASGSGTVELAGWFDIYGNCIILRHSNGYKTLYGHLNAYAKGVRKGTRVTQGQIIGYIGSTGMSTGPHLHYEVIFNGNKINPASIKSPAERNLTESELKRFYARKEQTDRLFADLMKNR